MKAPATKRPSVYLLHMRDAIEKITHYAESHTQIAFAEMKKHIKQMLKNISGSSHSRSLRDGVASSE